MAFDGTKEVPECLGMGCTGKAIASRFAYGPSGLSHSSG